MPADGRRNASHRRGGGAVLEGTVRDLGRGGDGIVATDKGVVFVAGAFPGERVRVRLTPGGTSKMRAGSLEKVLEVSPDRVTPPCVYAEACGGCAWIALSVPAQRRTKATMAERAVGLPLTLESSGEGTGYRRRARLQWIRTGQGTFLGYRAKRGHDVVDVARCVILEPALDAALSLVREHVAPHLMGKGEVQLAVGDGGRAVVGFATEAGQPEPVYRSVEALVRQHGFAGASLLAGGASKPAAFGLVHEVTSAGEGMAPLKGPFPGFAQANDTMNARLVATVLAWAAPQDLTVLELYAGAGNFTVPLARAAKTVRAIEENSDAVRYGQENLQREGLTNVTYVVGDAAAQTRGPADVIVLDPPRTGAKDAIAPILAIKPRRIVYVSCDLATLERDLGLLRAGGYAVEEARSFDMFPQTSHVETVVRLGLAAPPSGR